MCKKHRRLGVLLAIVLVGAVLALLRREPSEPVFEGRSLSQWLKRLNSQGPEKQHAEVAIRHIGTNALPYLLRWIRYEQPRWRIGLFIILHRLGGNVLPAWMLIDPGGARMNGAIDAWQVLGPEAKGAVEELSRLMQNPKEQTAARRAALVLPNLGPDALPSVLGALTNHQIVGRNLLALSTHRLAPDARPAVPLLVQCLKDNDWEVAFGAEYSLGKLRMEPDLAVPALTEALRHSHPSVRVGAAYALMHFGNEARPALSALLALLNDSDGAVRVAAADAIRAIDPEAMEPYDRP
jgi:hypothetical protein